MLLRSFRILLTPNASEGGGDNPPADPPKPPVEPPPPAPPAAPPKVDPPADPKPDPSESLQKLLEKNQGDAMRLAEKLYSEVEKLKGENADHRAAKRELKAKL